MMLTGIKTSQPYCVIILLPPHSPLLVFNISMDGCRKPVEAQIFFACLVVLHTVKESDLLMVRTCRPDQITVRLFVAIAMLAVLILAA